MRIVLSDEPTADIETDVLMLQAQVRLWNSLRAQSRQTDIISKRLLGDIFVLVLRSWSIVANVRLSLLTYFLSH